MHMSKINTFMYIHLRTNQIKYISRNCMTELKIKLSLVEMMSKTVVQFKDCERAQNQKQGCRARE